MNITDEAKDLIQSLLTEKNAGGIRIYFSGMGWGGPDLGLALDEPEENDIVKTIHNIRVSIDSKIVEFTENIILDCQNGPDGVGLVILENQSGCC